MHKIFIPFLVFLFISCETNPPTAPISLKTGEVLIEVSVTEDNNINSDRTVLLEDFANVSCVPCVTSNKIIQSILHSYGPDKVVSIKFPTNFPSPVDPFYLAAKGFCDFRMNYYHIISAPTIYLDGVLRPLPTDSNAVKQFLNDRIAVGSNFKIDVTKTINNGGLLINLDIKVKNKSTINIDELFLKCVIVESDVEFANPPGSNGETKFFDVLRVLFPSNDGVAFSSLQNMQSFQYEDVIDTVWNINKLEIVTFIQNTGTKEIYQAGATL